MKATCAGDQKRFVMSKILSTLVVIASMLVVSPIVANAQEEGPKEEIKTEVKTQEIPYEIKYVFNRDLGAGRVKKVTNGENGKIITTFTKVIRDGVVIHSDTSVEKIDPKPAVFHMGKSGFTASSRGAYERATVMTMEATAYLPTDGSGHGITATGRRAKYGVVAVDPKVIPLHSLVFVEGYGFAIAADTGGAIKGKKIDLCMHDRAEALRFGRRKVVVHVFKGRHPKK